MVNVIVGKKRNIQISTDETSGVISTSTPVTLKGGVGLSGSTRLDRLTDVDATNEIAGATLVYNSPTDTYVVKKLEFDNVEGNLDGGSF